MTKHFVIATAGHVDHGKSSLVKALTGTDPDRLPEEKARQITIDLGFAELNLHDAAGNQIHAAIVDVPGHEDFVRNMIAGVGSIDLALFVVAADDGWMPQTEEHLQILEYLGIERAVIALTKIDIGNSDSVMTQIRTQLSGTRFADSPVIPVSVPAETGLDDLRNALASELSKREPQRDIGKPRLFVDRAFTLRGIGTVVTGTLTGGTLRRGDFGVIQPREQSARIRSLQTHGRDVDLAEPGMRTALNLPELEIEKEIRRGDAITAAGFKTASVLGAVLVKSPRSPKRSLKDRAQVYLHHGTSRIAARIHLLEKEPLRTGERAIARIHLDSPVLAFLGDRFVLRDPSERSTIAGGVVLDPDGSRSPDLLRQRAAAPNDVDLCVRTEVECNRAIPITALLRQSHFSAEEIHAAVQRLNIRLQNGIAIDPQYWDSLRERAVNLIDHAHHEFPDKSGLELSDLRVALRNVSPELIDAIIADLCAGEFVRARSTIARQGHRPALPVELRNVAQNILKELSTRPFDPPARVQIAPEAKAQQALRFLIDRGDVVDLGPGVIVLAENFARMRDVIVSYISRNGAATVSQLRQELQTSRRVMVPLIERLDRDGVTRRFGDERKLAGEIVSHRTLK